ncbi:MAG TPA: hypothetical protein VG917_00235 [Patescibacteria group bacterium]|nr:hypothetical protein [Patescibacteria group bacterium]
MTQRYQALLLSPALPVSGGLILEGVGSIPACDLSIEYWVDILSNVVGSVISDEPFLWEGERVSAAAAVIPAPIRPAFLNLFKKFRSCELIIVL